MPARVTKSGRSNNLYLFGTFAFKDYMARFTDTESGKHYVFNLRDKDQVKPKMGKLIHANREFIGAERLETGSKGVFRVTISGNGKRLWNMCPTFGTAHVKFVQFHPRQNDIPTPRISHGEYGEFKTFLVEMEIVEDPLKGLHFTSSMFYKWARGGEEDGDLAGQILYTDNGQTTDYVLSFTDAAGIEEVLYAGLKHPPNDNVLPILEDVAIRKGRTFVVRFDTDSYRSVAKYFPLFEKGVREVEVTPEEVEDSWEETEEDELDSGWGE